MPPTQGPSRGHFVYIFLSENNKKRRKLSNLFLRKKNYGLKIRVGFPKIPKSWGRDRDLKIPRETRGEILRFYGFLTARNFWDFLVSVFFSISGFQSSGFGIFPNFGIFLNYGIFSRDRDSFRGMGFADKQPSLIVESLF